MIFFILLGAILANSASPLKASDVDYELAYKVWKTAELDVDATRQKANQASISVEQLRRDISTAEYNIKEMAANLDIKEQEQVRPENEISKLDHDKAHLTWEADNLKIKREELYSRLEELEHEIRDLKNGVDLNLLKKLQSTLKTLKRKRARLERKIHKVEDKAESIKSSLGIVDKKLVKLSEEQNRLKVIIKESQDPDLVRKAQEELEFLFRLTFDKIELREKLKKDYQESQKKIENLYTELATLKKDLADLDSEVEDRVQIVSTIAKKETQAETLKDESQELSDLILSIDVKLVTIQSSINSSKMEISTLESVKIQLAHELFNLRLELTSQEDKLQEAEEDSEQLSKKLEELRRIASDAWKRYREVLSNYQEAKRSIIKTAVSHGRSPGLAAGEEVAIRIGHDDGIEAGATQGYTDGITFAHDHAFARGNNYGLEEGFLLRLPTHPDVRSENLAFDELSIPALPSPTLTPAQRIPAVDRRYYQPQPQPEYKHKDFYTLYMDFYDQSYTNGFREGFHNIYSNEFFPARDDAYAVAFQRGQLTVDYNEVYEQARTLGRKYGFLAPSLSKKSNSEIKRLYYCGEQEFSGYTLQQNNLHSLKPYCKGDSIEQGFRIVVCAEGSAINKLSISKEFSGFIDNLKLICSSGEEILVLPLQEQGLWETISCPADKYLAGNQAGYTMDQIDDVIGICQY